MMRLLKDSLSGHFDKYAKILVLLGARQVGKTTLVQKVFPDAGYFSVDNEPIKKALETYDSVVYTSLFRGQGTVIIDEIHRLSDPGRCAKIIFDHLQGIKLVITGSSSFHIKHRTSESLAGRKIDYMLYPLTITENLFQQGIIAALDCRFFTKLLDGTPRREFHSFDTEYFLHEAMLHGLYPDMLNIPGDEKYLRNLVDSIIFKDILELNLIENRRLAADLLKLLAHQIGSLVNYAELASSLKADQRTIKRYMEIFEHNFIIFRLNPFTTNRRDEIIKSPKIYFADLGVRNALIDDFSPIDTRRDRGAIFENFLIAEYMKCNSYLNTEYRFHFWRTKQGSEVDLVLQKNGKLFGIEIKYGKKRTSRAFLNHYPDARLVTVTKENWL